MAKRLCSCGSCKRCKHREYMRRWYHRTDDSWQEKDYAASGSGGPALLKCKHCGIEYQTTVRNAKRSVYCSRACKDRARKDELIRAREQSKPDRWCRHCGAAMPKRMRSDAAYCSNKCNVAAHSQVRKASMRTGAKEKRIDRASVIARDGGRCHLCGAFPKGRDLTIDHVIPLAKGGHHAAENLRVACLSCNASKKDRLNV